MKTKIEIKSMWGSVLFSYKKEDNTIKDALEEAVKSGAYLGGAYLGGANLRGANLGGANLGGAYLGGDWGKLQKTEDILMVGPIGSRNGCTTIFHTDRGDSLCVRNISTKKVRI